MNRYTRPAATQKPDKTTREQLIHDYYAHYAALAKADPEALKIKLPRRALADVLDEIGGRLLDEAVRLVREDGPLKALLDQNPPPTALQPYLPDSFRAFCLILNSLKQWVAKEQKATDEYFLGGRARAECRASTLTCLITGELMGADAELHHPVRDGRPPLYISKAGHDFIEGQSRRGIRNSSSTTSTLASANSTDTPVARSIMALVRSVKRKESWKQLRRGCLDRLGRDASHSTSEAVQRNARKFATDASKVTKLGFEEILAWMDANKLGLDL